ncbi:unnamed protein product [Schistosoma margrebowiei]|uniref:Uncharacterized protein n=1 Tax=Schistosoma margrebowiei TaxID=48269 RepID=A0A183LRZ9_9TREM|nr:unnamed protein product [Schistosoma margrebowiei]
MWETRRVFQIDAEMRRYNLEVLGISKKNWTQVGQQRLASGEKNAPIYTRSCIDAVQTSIKYTYRMGISWTKDHQSLLQNKERVHYNERHPTLCAYQRLK